MFQMPRLSLRALAGLLPSLFAFACLAQAPAWEVGAVLEVSTTSRALALGARESGPGLGHSDLMLSGPVGSAWTGRVMATAGALLRAGLAVPVLGLFVVFACLIAPALWVKCGLALRWALLGGMACALLGLLLSWQADWPSGACVALVLSLYGACSVGMRQRPTTTDA
jgi:hypothetical protein